MYRSILRALILGDGLLGSELAIQTGWPVASRKLGNLNINSYWELYDLISSYDVIVNCIANTDSYSTNKEAHWNVNYEFAVKLSDLCKLRAKKLVHISTEFVYAGNTYPPTEEDLPLPDHTWYAYTKLLADEYIKLTNDNFLICRELHKPKNTSYPEVWSVKTSGDTVDKIAELIIRLISKNAKGVYNVGTGSKFLKEIMGTDEEVSPPVHVPKDTSMNLDKLNKFLQQ